MQRKYKALEKRHEIIYELLEGIKGKNHDWKRKYEQA